MPTKCATCSRKISISTEFQCSCDKTKRYCPEHRYPDRYPNGHSCPIPPKQLELPRVVAVKLNKI